MVTSAPISSSATRWTASVTGSANRTVPPGRFHRPSHGPPIRRAKQHAELRADDDLHGEPGDLLEDRLVFGLRERAGHVVVR